MAVLNRIAHGVATTILAVALAAQASAGDVPVIGTTSLSAPLPLPYDESADAHAQLAVSLEHAKAEHKFLLLDFGGNWCPDCRVFMGALLLPEARPAIRRNFDILTIDVGRLTKNLDIAQLYGIDIKAVPTVIVLDPDGHMVNAGNPAALSDARSMTPQAIIDTVFHWIGKSR